MADALGLVRLLQLGLSPTQARDSLLAQVLGIDPGALSATGGVEGSMADRLRPPYLSPFPGMEPLNPQAGRTLEVGYGRLPIEYQTALAQLPFQQPTRVGVMPEGYNYRGMHIRPERVNPVLVASAPQNMAHELVHELALRKGTPWGQGTEETLAQVIAGDESAQGGAAALARDNMPDLADRIYAMAREADTGIRYDYPPPGLGLLARLYRVMFGTPGAENFQRKAQ